MWQQSLGCCSVVLPKIGNQWLGVLRFKLKYVWPKVHGILLSISHYARRQKLLSTRSKNLADSLHLTYTFSEKIRARHIQWSMQHLKVGLLTGNLPTDSTLLLMKQTYSKQICLRKLLSKVSCKEESILLSRLKYLDMHTVAWFLKNLSLMESNPKPPEWQEKT